MRLESLRKVLKKSNFLVKIYRKIKKIPEESFADYSVQEAKRISARKLEELGDELRLNLVIPSVKKVHVFGGIATAITFFEALSKELNVKVRIITTDCSIYKEESIELNGYTEIKSEENSVIDKQLIGFAVRENKTLPVGKNDIFITTGWWTAYAIAPVVRWQKKVYNSDKINKLIYLIQDYEPGFYPWSSRYLMADSTYKLDIPTIAVFNSKLLKEYFDKYNYKFDSSYYFEPTLNSNLKEYLLNNSKPIQRKKQIIVYGRPSVQRNAFELVVASLKRWAEQQENISEWTVYSVGEKHSPVSISEDIVLKSMGKLTLEEYANVMLETYMALSLMVSPHPSYPPLEMSTFGIKTITNTYTNKDLSAFNNNIISLSNCSADSIADEMLKLCSEYTTDNKPILNSEYFNSENAFEQICKNLKDNYFSIFN